KEVAPIDGETGKRRYEPRSDDLQRARRIHRRNLRPQIVDLKSNGFAGYLRKLAHIADSQPVYASITQSLRRQISPQLGGTDKRRVDLDALQGRAAFKQQPSAFPESEAFHRERLSWRIDFITRDDLGGIHAGQHRNRRHNIERQRIGARVLEWR